MLIYFSPVYLGVYGVFAIAQSVYFIFGKNRIVRFLPGIISGILLLLLLSAAVFCFVCGDEMEGKAALVLDGFALASLLASIIGAGFGMAVRRLHRR